MRSAPLDIGEFASGLRGPAALVEMDDGVSIHMVYRLGAGTVPWQVTCVLPIETYFLT
jgi:hypothetical protein